jgi:hypothetical protein
VTVFEMCRPPEKADFVSIYFAKAYIIEPISI